MQAPALPECPDTVWLELAGIGRWWWHLPTGTEYHDDGWHRLLGLAPQPGATDVAPWLARLHPDDRAEVDARLRDVSSPGFGDRYEAIFRLRHADGDYRWIWSRGRVLSRTALGGPEWLAGTHLDISKQMGALHDLQRDENWLAVFDKLAQGFRFVTVYDRHGLGTRVECISDGAHALLGLPPERLREDVGHLRDRMPPEDRRQVERTIARTIAARSPLLHLDYRVRTPDDPLRPVHWLRALATGEYLPDGSSRWYGYALDVTDLVDQVERQQAALRDLEATLSASPDIWFELDADGRYVRVSAPDPSRLAVPAAQLIGKTPHEALPPPLAGRIVDALQRVAATRATQSLQYPLELDGEVRHFETRIAPRYAGERLLGYVALARDITETVLARTAREHALLHDPLTGLWNRAGFLDGGVTRWIDRHRGCRDAHCVLLMLDIDGLRQLNHALGTAVGDDLIKAVAQRLAASADDCVIGRVGGDELAALCHVRFAAGSAAPADVRAARWVSLLQQALAAPIRLGNLDYRPSLTVGWTMLPCSEGINLPLVRDALVQVEESLYAAKRQGPGRLERFDAQRFAAGRHRHLLAQALSGALSNRELWLAYQPIVDSHGTPIGCEALLRWRSPLHGEVPPMEFIGLAEQSRAIIAIGRWALRQACAQAAGAAPPPGAAPAYVAVNVSPLQFMQPDFEDDVCRALLDSGLPAHRLRLEVTESLLIDDLPAVAAKMQRLAELGVRFALDDFGTGYSNLLQLRSLPLDTIKIDRSFTRDLFTDENDALIVRSIVELAHRLHLRVVAEGVETAAQVEWLTDCGCDALQGYWFGRPGPWGHGDP